MVHFSKALQLFSLRFLMLVLERLYVRSCDGGAVVRSLSDMIVCSVRGGGALEVETFEGQEVF